MVFIYRYSATAIFNQLPFCTTAVLHSSSVYLKINIQKITQYKFSHLKILSKKLSLTLNMASSKRKFLCASSKQTHCPN